MRKILLILVLLSLSAISFAQVQELWAVPYSYNSSSEDFTKAIAVDAEGNTYVAGATHRTDADYEDYITIVKYDKNGNKLWGRNYGGASINGGLEPVAMVLDAASNVYITGSSIFGGNVFTTLKFSKDGTPRWIQRFAGLPDYNHGNAAGLAVDPEGNVYVTGFVHTAPFNTENFYDFTVYVTVKYDALGDQKWVRSYNGTSPGNGINKASAITVDNLGNAYVTGKSQLNGQLDYVTIKYSTTGSPLWAARYEGPLNQDDEATAIVLDGSNNVYVTGKSNSNTQADYVTLKYDNNGNELWAARYDGTGGDIPSTICMNQDGNVCVTGRSYAGSQDYNYATVVYNNNGIQQWARQFNNSASSEDQATDMVTDGDANIYVTGTSDRLIATVKYNSTGTLQWSKTYGSFGTTSLLDDNKKMSIAVDLTGNVYVAGEYDPGPPGGIDERDFITIRYSQCNIVCPANITVNNDADQCGAIVTFADVITTGDCGSSLTYSHASETFFPVGTTTVTVTSDETGATCSFTITVNDNQLPVLTCPVNKLVNMNAGLCYATVDAGSATATDNCGATVIGVRSDNLALNANYPGGVTTITWTATDPSNNTSTCVQTISVVDNEPPVITGGTASAVVLSPSNHTMRDVAISYTATDNCAVTSVVNVTSNEPINGVGDGDTDPDWIVTDNHHVVLRAERSANGTGRIYTITITATDGSGNTATKTVEVRVPHNIKNPHSGQPFKVGSTVSFEGEFWDKAGNTHSAKWLIDENITAKATVTEPVGNKNGKVTGSYKFTAPGVYKLQMNVSDQKGITHYSNTAGDLEAIVVIYDPNGGYAYGGGYYDSPAGALRSDPTATGKASYGFTMNYFKNSTYPKGETQFDFKVGSFEFNALNFEYLVINNSMSQFKGTGKIIGGQSGVGFTMTVVDGQLDGSGVDKIRMKIYNRSNGSIIYDNQPGASDAALPTQAVGTNSTIVISGTNSSLTSANTNQKAEIEAKVPEVSIELDVIAFPNPSTNNFTINVNAKTNERVTMQVVDMYGRIIETRNVAVNSLIRFGERYIAGTYFVRVIQGKQHKEIKLVKLPD